MYFSSTGTYFIKPSFTVAPRTIRIPAVDSNDDIGVGMERRLQVYARSIWYNDVRLPSKGFSYGMIHSTEWEYVIIWVDNPGLEPYDQRRNLAIRLIKKSTLQLIPITSTTLVSALSIVPVEGKY
ncbi:unnamed protein product [Phytophthora fragariaefolia]|uniref:Unnamed protein product n=1 Tax=Phytophthora fragariaefolia TaxID=1490495 RepID=A0A9W6XWS7_9STRA|nr:unnamed protein product [Phytophthora fragariaefolia]